MEDEVLNREFLASLEARYQNVRENRVNTFLRLARAADIPFDAETRRKYVDAALELDPNSMAVALHDIMCSEASALSERASAARLYLYGGDKGVWKVPAPAAERARALLAPPKSQPMKPAKEQRMKNGRRIKSWGAIAALTTDEADPIGLLQAAYQADARMRAVLDDPTASNAAKIEAAARFFIVHDLITEKLNANPPTKGVPSP